MTYKPNRSPWEYFKVRTVWPTVIHGRPKRKATSTIKKKTEKTR